LAIFSIFFDRIEYIKLTSLQFTCQRLEELVGGRLHCAFYQWTQRSQKCIEDGEPMGMLPSLCPLEPDETVPDLQKASFLHKSNVFDFYE
jgi:hypothetical protein